MSKPIFVLLARLSIIFFFLRLSLHFDSQFCLRGWLNLMHSLNCYYCWCSTLFTVSFLAFASLTGYHHGVD